MEKTIQLQRMTLTYDFAYKTVKRINLRVRADGSVSLSAPYGTAQTLIDSFLFSKEGWIARALAARQNKEEGQPEVLADGSNVTLFGIPQRVVVKKGKTNRVEWDGRHLLFTVKKEDPTLRIRLYKVWQAELCRQTVLPFCKKHQSIYEKKGIETVSFSFRKMKTRWGSCQPQKGRISFNILLTEKPLPFIEYVVVHELTHFLHPDHSPAFYNAVGRVLPDWEERKRL